MLPAFQSETDVDWSRGALKEGLELSVHHSALGVKADTPKFTSESLSESPGLPDLPSHPPRQARHDRSVAFAQTKPNIVGPGSHSQTHC